MIRGNTKRVEFHSRWGPIELDDVQSQVMRDFNSFLGRDLGDGETFIEAKTAARLACAASITRAGQQPAEQDI